MYQRLIASGYRPEDIQRMQQQGVDPTPYVQALNQPRGNYPVQQPGVNPVPFYAGDDPNRMLENERARAAGFGDLLWEGYRQDDPYFRERERRFGGLAEQAYDPILRGEGGYRPGEAADILREGETEGLALTPGERAARYMTPEEQASYLGDPRTAQAYLNPQQMYNIINEGTARQREDLTRGAGRIREATRAESLGQDPLFAGSQEQALQTMEEGVRGAIDRERLGLSEDFARDYPITDDEISQTAQIAHRSAQLPYQAAYDEAARRSASSASTPLALAGLRARMARQAAQSGAEAATKARLAGMEQQREQQRRLEEMRLGSERDISGRQERTEFGLGGERLATQSDIERQRQRGEQVRQGLIAGTEADLMNQALATSRNQAAQQIGAEEFQQSLGAGLEQAAEQEASRRRGVLSDIRRGTEAGTQEERWRRGIGIGDRLSGRTRDIAQERLGQEREARGFLTGQQAQAGQRAGQVRSQATAGVGTTGALTQGAARARKQRRGPGGFERVVNSLISGASGRGGGGGVPSFAEGGMVTKPTLAVLGEDGPEIVLPMKKEEGVYRFRLKEPSSARLRRAA